MELEKKVLCRLYLDIDADAYGLFYRYGSSAAIRQVSDHSVVVATSLKARYLNINEFNNLTKKTFDLLLHNMTGFSLN